MKQFCQLIRAIDESNRTTDKLAALKCYFVDAPPEDAAWALYFLTGRRLKRAVRTGQLREWISEIGGVPLWLVEECYDHVGDLAETLALLHPGPETAASGKPQRDGDVPALHRLVEEFLLPLPKAEDSEKRSMLESVWGMLDSRERLVWNKLITGGWRIGVARTLVTRALAEVHNIDPAVMAHRLLDPWEPNAESYRRITSRESSGNPSPAQPYPFFLATPLETSAEELGSVGEWCAEWKWDGIRAQLIRRLGRSLLWSRGEEFITHSFPEIEMESMGLPDGTVLDGEILAWDYEESLPKPFDHLQQRLNRKTVSRRLQEKIPVLFLAYDILEHGSKDIREWPLHSRIERLNEVVPDLTAPGHLRRSPQIDGASWADLAAIRKSSRERKVEGLMLKRLSSPYRVGRPRGDWFKWKIDPWTADMVLLYAQRGHGRRASLFTDYTFGVHDGDRIVTVAKAYSGLTDSEIGRIDQWIKANTVKRHGPIHEVPPAVVFEIAFEGIRYSSRHKSGIALRFPRISRIRDDKTVELADSLDSLKKLIDGPGLD